jgi:hypothetical protein
MAEEATRKISNNNADSHNTRRGFNKHDDTNDDANKTKTPTSKWVSSRVNQSPAHPQN